MKRTSLAMKASPWAAWAFLLPALIPLTLFLIYPALNVIFLSFHEWNGLAPDKTFVGLSNYTDLMTSEEFRQVFSNSIIFVLETVPASIVLGLILALLVWKIGILKGFFRASLFLPTIISTVGAGIVWVWMFNTDSGVINRVLGLVGISPVNWLGAEGWAMAAVSIMTVWKTAGYNMVIFLAGLQGIPDTYFEACYADGVESSWKRFRYITLPLLRPATVFVFITSIIFSFRSFDQIYVMTHGGPVGSTRILVYYIYEEGFKFFRMGHAAAASVILLIFVLIITILQLKFAEEKQ